ncbi:MAG TPA: ABC transporter permease [Methylomirabilota bacterium]|jgi:peptide/nickel transport system permease protein|nr:ABC transporter permease [Methylomirabilota bacterium]
MGATASGPVEVPAAAPASPAAPLAVPASRPAAAARLRRHPLVLVGGAILLAVVLASALAPLLTGADPVRPSFGQRLRPPWGLGGSAARPLGADNLGRDILARLLYGGRVSLALATSAVVLATGAGVLAGLLAGWLGGRVDDLVMRIADVQLAFPVIMLAIAIVAVVGTSPIALVGVLALSGWVLHARTVRANVLTIRQLEYVEAAAALGASRVRTVFRHVLPNTLAPILVIASSQFATMVLLESGLSFLGLGVQPPRPSWGGMLAEGRDYLSSAWWLATMPGAAISLVVLGANLLGDGLRDLLDPHLGR